MRTSGRWPSGGRHLEPKPGPLPSEDSIRGRKGSGTNPIEKGKRGKTPQKQWEDVFSPIFVKGKEESRPVQPNQKLRGERGEKNFGKKGAGLK